MFEEYAIRVIVSYYPCFYSCLMNAKDEVM